MSPSKLANPTQNYAFGSVIAALAVLSARAALVLPDSLPGFGEIGRIVDLIESASGPFYA
jgi:hypothetical protein